MKTTDLLNGLRDGLSGTIAGQAETKALAAVAKAEREDADSGNADEPSYDVVSALNRNTRHVRLLMVVPEI